MGEAAAKYRRRNTLVVNEGSISENPVIFPQFPPFNRFIFTGSCGQPAVTLYTSCLPTDVFFTVNQDTSGPNCAVTITGVSANPCCAHQTLVLPSGTNAFTPSILFQDVTQISAQCSSSGTPTTCSFDYTLSVVECKPCLTSTNRSMVVTSSPLNASERAVARAIDPAGRLRYGRVQVNEGSASGNVVIFPITFPISQTTLPCGQSAVIFTSCRPVDVLFSPFLTATPSCNLTFSGTSPNPCCQNQTLAVPGTAMFQPTILFKDVTQILAQCASNSTGAITCTFNYMFVTVECKPCVTQTRRRIIDDLRCHRRQKSTSHSRRKVDPPTAPIARSAFNRPGAIVQVNEERDVP